MQSHRSTEGQAKTGEIVALFSGPVPEHGAKYHTGGLIASSGSFGQNEAGQVPLLDHDRITELEINAGTIDLSVHGESLWILVRPTSPITDAHILVVEDSEINGLYYQDILGGAGADVHRTASGAEALNLVEDHTFDLALVDVRLPDANGYELCQRLSASDRRPNLRILLMSADTTTLNPTRVTSVGASGFVINPIRPEELMTTVTAALDLGRSNIILPSVASSNHVAQQTFLRLFGRPAVWSGQGWIDLPSGRSAELLATLAAACPNAVPAERLSELVWDRNLAISSNAMYSAISRLRRQMSGTSLEEAVVTDGLGYRLDIDPGSIDLVDFETRAKGLIGRSGSTIAELRELLEIWIGDAFHSTNNDVLLNWQHRLRELRAQALESLAVRLTVSGRAAEAIGLCRDLVNVDPWRESAWSLLIVALYRAGQPEDSLSAYRAAVTQLREDLGLDPGPGLAAFEAKVLNHDASLLDNEWVVQIANSLNRQTSPI